jgi:hypothetical protein
MEERCWAPLYPPLYTCLPVNLYLHHLLNVPVHVANKMGFHKKKKFLGKVYPLLRGLTYQLGVAWNSKIRKRLNIRLSSVCNATAIRTLNILLYNTESVRSSGQSSWLQIQRPGFDSRHYKIFWEVVGLERGPPSLVSTTEELLDRSSSGSGLEIL